MISLKKHKLIVGIFLSGLILPFLVNYLTHKYIDTKQIKTEAYYFVADFRQIPDMENLPEADCWVHSLSSLRPDALRCSNNHQVIDPCFLTEPYVVCPENPYKEAKYFTIDTEKAKKALQEIGGTDAGYPFFPSTEVNVGNNYPWYIELVKGVKCHFVTGMTRSVIGERMDYACDDDKTSLLLPVMEDESLQRIKCYKEIKVGTCEIKKLWY
jgi:hypothetical protein